MQNFFAGEIKSKNMMLKKTGQTLLSQHKTKKKLIATNGETPHITFTSRFRQKNYNNCFYLSSMRKAPFVVICDGICLLLTISKAKINYKYVFGCDVEEL